MEVAGLIASCSTIIRFSISIITGLDDLRERLRDADVNIQALRAQVDSVREGILGVREWLEYQRVLEEAQIMTVGRSLNHIEETLLRLDKAVGKEITLGKKMSTRKRVAHLLSKNKIDGYQNTLNHQLSSVMFQLEGYRLINTPRITSKLHSDAERGADPVFDSTELASSSTVSIISSVRSGESSLAGQSQSTAATSIAESGLFKAENLASTAPDVRKNKSEERGSGRRSQRKVPLDPSEYLNSTRNSPPQTPRPFHVGQSRMNNPKGTQKSVPVSDHIRNQPVATGTQNQWTANSAPVTRRDARNGIDLRSGDGISGLSASSRPVNSSDGLRANDPHEASSQMNEARIQAPSQWRLPTRSETINTSSRSISVESKEDQGRRRATRDNAVPDKGRTRSQGIAGGSSPQDPDDNSDSSSSESTDATPQPQPQDIRGRRDPRRDGDDASSVLSSIDTAISTLESLVHPDDSISVAGSQNENNQAARVLKGFKQLRREIRNCHTSFSRLEVAKLRESADQLQNSLTDLLQNQSPQTGNEKLLEAIRIGDCTMVERMLRQAGAPFNARNERRETVVHIAALNGHLAIVKTLIKFGRENNCLALEARDCHQRTVLQAYCSQPSVSWKQKNVGVEIVKALLQAGANLNAPVRHGQTPALSSAMKHRAPLNIIEKLLYMGADVNPPARQLGRAGKSPIEHCCSWVHSKSKPGVVQMLLDAGANIQDRLAGAKNAVEYALASLRTMEDEIFALEVEDGLKLSILYLPCEYYRANAKTVLLLFIHLAASPDLLVPLSAASRMVIRTSFLFEWCPNPRRSSRNGLRGFVQEAQEPLRRKVAELSLSTELDLYQGLKGFHAR